MQDIAEKPELSNLVSGIVQSNTKAQLSGSMKTSPKSVPVPPKIKTPEVAEPDVSSVVADVVEKEGSNILKKIGKLLNKKYLYIILAIVVLTLVYMYFKQKNKKTKRDDDEDEDDDLRYKRLEQSNTQQPQQPQPPQPPPQRGYNRGPPGNGYAVGRESGMPTVPDHVLRPHLYPPQPQQQYPQYPPQQAPPQQLQLAPPQQLQQAPAQQLQQAPAQQPQVQQLQVQQPQVQQPQVQQPQVQLPLNTNIPMTDKQFDKQLEQVATGLP